MFQRDFMEYHKERFLDCSLMIYKKDSLFALLPANSADNHVFSHQGLTYGGLLLGKDSKFEDVLEAFKVVLKHLNDNGFNSLQLKLLPKIYHKLPSDEINYLMFISEAQLIRSDLSAVVDMSNPISITSTNRKRNLKKAKANAIEVKEVNEFESFFNKILVPNLQERHEAMPTHSVDEINSLKSKFPSFIRQFNAYYQNEIIAGVTIFESEKVAHAQYISTLNSKKEFAGLDAIFDELMHSIYKHKRYFSFGISNVNQGQNINQGLLKWKESFGARSIVHDFYDVKTENYNLLNKVFI